VAALFAIADRAAEALGAAFPRLTAAALVLFLLFRVAAMADFYRRPGWTRVETAAGLLVLPEPVAETTRLALADLTARLPASSTVAGYPEAGFFNYVLGRRNPFAHEQYFPGHLDAAGQERTTS